MSVRMRSQHESLETIAKVLRRYIFLPNLDPLYIIMGTVVGNFMPNLPIWTMLIGGPSSGGSTLISNVTGRKGRDSDGNRWVVDGTVGCFAIDELRSAAALLSGSPKKDKAKDSTGGVLREIGEEEPGVIVLSDFTPILSMRHETLTDVLGSLRMVFDGKYARPVGSDGGRTLRWEGKCGLITKCTGAIESHQAMMSELGQRFLYYRYPITTGRTEARVSLAVPSDVQRGRDISLALCTHLNDVIPRARDAMRPLEPHESGWIEDAAIFVTKARSPVKREKSLHNTIDWVPPPEVASRFAQSCKALFLGMLAAGVEDPEAMGALAQVAWGCIPAVRARVLRAVVDILNVDKELAFTNLEVATRLEFYAGVEGYIMMHPNTVGKTLEDLEYLGIVVKTKGTGRGSVKVWGLSKWAREAMRGMRLLR